MKRFPLLSAAAVILALAPVSYVVYDLSLKGRQKLSPPKTVPDKSITQMIDEQARTNQLKSMHEQTLLKLEQTQYVSHQIHQTQPKKSSTMTITPTKPKNMKVGHLQPTHQVHHAVTPPALAQPVNTGPKLTLTPVATKPATSSAPSHSTNSTSNTTGNASGNATSNATGQGTNNSTKSGASSGASSPLPVATPAIPNLPGLSVFGYVTGSSASLSDALAHPVNIIGADSFGLNWDGGITGYDLSGVQSSGRLSYAVVADFGQSVNSVLSSPTATNNLIQNLVSLAVTHHYAGINVDFEMISSSKETQLDNFIATLETQLHANGKLLSMAVPPESGYEYWYDAYNYAFLGAHVDQLVLMTYDYSYSGSTPGAVAPLWWVSNVLRYAVNRVPAHKILLGIGAYGYDWTNNQPPGQARGLLDIENQVQSSHISPIWDQGDSVPYFNYQDSSGKTHTVYYEDETSIADKLVLAKQYGLGGISIWRMGLEDPTFWQAAAPYASGH